MVFDIVIPSYHRLLKLYNCLETIDKAKKSHNISVYIYFSDDKDLKSFENKYCDYSEVRMFPEYRVPLFWNSHLKQMSSDAIIYLNDDILLFENTLDVIETKFKEYFPDTDGIMGIHQSNLGAQGMEYAFGVIGKKYFERFPDGKLWCPEYFRFFCDQEMCDYAKSINKFRFCKEAEITHLHPSVVPGMMDETHTVVRQWLSRDRFIHKLRKQNNLLWGREFARVIEE